MQSCFVRVILYVQLFSVVFCMVKVVHTFYLKVAIKKTTNGDQWNDGHGMMEIHYFFERNSMFSPLAVVVSNEGPDSRYAGQLHSLE